MKWTLAILFFLGCCLLLISCDTVEPQSPKLWHGCANGDSIIVDNRSSVKAIVHITRVNTTFINVFDSGEFLEGMAYDGSHYRVTFWYSVSGNMMQGRFLLHKNGDVITDTHLILERKWH